MGQKVNPRGLRIGTVLKWKNNWYTEPSNYLSKFYKNLNIKNLIKTFLLLKSERSLLVDFFIYDINGYKSLLLISFYNLEDRKILKKKRTDFSLMKYKVKKLKTINNKNISTKLYALKLNNQNISNFFNNNLNKYKLLINFTNNLDKRANKFYMAKFNNIYIESKYKNGIKFYNGLHHQLNIESKIINKSLNVKLLNLKLLNKLTSTNIINKTLFNQNYILNSFKFVNSFITKIYYQILKFVLLYKIKQNKLSINNKSTLIFSKILLFNIKKLFKNLKLRKLFKKQGEFNNGIFLLTQLKLQLFNFNTILKFKTNNLVKTFNLLNNSSMLQIKEFNNLSSESNYKNSLIKTKKKSLLTFLKLSKLNFNDTKNINNLILNNKLIQNYLNKTDSLFLVNKHNLLNKNKLNNFKYTNLYQFKRILNVLNKMNYKVFLYNIKSLFNFSKLNLLNNNSLNLQKQKINRYFDISRKLKKRFNKRWKRINFLGSDLMNIAQYSLFFKNPTLLAYFISYQFTFLPKNKRQTSFAKYVSKILFNFKGEFNDIQGLKLQFKGRFNKWSRSKKWIAQAGTILLQSYNSCVDYSCSKGLVKKGIFSTRIWIQYDLNTKYKLKKNILKYFQYSYIRQKFKK